jgi:hypothetical protein
LWALGIGLDPEVLSMHDKPFRFVPKCALCGRAKNQHRAVSLECPAGKRTPIGYVEFGSQRFREAASSADNRATLPHRTDA